jgi:hypothetical protein
MTNCAKCGCTIRGQATIRRITVGSSRGAIVGDIEHQQDAFLCQRCASTHDKKSLLGNLSAVILVLAFGVVAMFLYAKLLGR